MTREAVCVALEVPSLVSDSVLESACRLYAQLFGAPPLNRQPMAFELQRRTLHSLLSEPTFGMATAWDGGRLVGFVYGYTLRADTQWWDNLMPAVPDDLTAETEGRTFAIIDLAVDHAYHRRGIGSRLMDTLLASRPEERSSLSVAADNDAAREFYRHLGWRYVGRAKGAPHHSAPFFDKFLLGLR